MKIGFTGTRRGTTSHQEELLHEWLLRRFNAEDTEHSFHHGCEPHSDTTAAYIAKDIGFWVVGHPGPGSLAGVVAHEVRPKKPFLERNRDIVDETEILVATPAGKEVLRSGTWMTIRYARDLRRPIVIIWPDGIITKENY